MDGEKDFSDVYFGLNSGSPVNVGHLFETDKSFCSRRDLQIFVRNVGQKNNIGIVVTASRGGDGKGLGDAVVYFGCERSLSYRRNKEKDNTSEVKNKKRSSGTKRCNCPFRLKGKEISAGEWRLFVIDGNHNHDFPIYNVGRSIMSRLSEDEKLKAKEMTQAHVPPSQILISIKNENKENLTTMKQVYNYRQTLRKEEMGDRSVTQQLLSYLNKESYFFSYRASPTDVVTDLFFANKKAVQLLHQFYYVLIMDCTYKTNKYKMPLLQIVGCVPTGKNFVVGLAFLQDEKKDSFEWALQCTKALFDQNHLPEVIVTDREYALMNAIDGVFPSSYHMLCTRHIAKNVESRAKVGTRSEIFARGFVGRWNQIVHAETEVDYEEKNTWLIHAKKFVHAYTNKVLHFGNRTTNRVESAHNALKRFLKTSTGSLDTIWSRVHSFLELQENEIKASFVRSTNKDLHISVLHLLTGLTGKISHVAIKKDL
ncbi:hypothetical protein DCAR_0832529 [Daucus carota subsp. sativus]|uniref:MULE transposase domain-containing protein n=1 Tax=Daucus carota subsp. sativus TaxID=79200 RepID=A0AAF0XRT7_DAUCS|nr:PREDICTED: protein FAR1-RELATED SEQUENCE 5-like [Daucus carota subsp. sativus]WOH13020.1 hypothetical protein DCAR_0832529 [Daucus carota subsp. sativus]